jgi:hypothetical protein
MLGCMCLTVLMLFTISFIIHSAQAIPSSDFTEKMAFGLMTWELIETGLDATGICLTSYQTLDENKELAFILGEPLKERYTGKIESVVAILKCVQKWTDYGYDKDNAIIGGIARDDWA